MSSSPSSTPAGDDWRVRELRLAAGSRVLVEALSLRFAPGELWCIAGPNGAGKTTLISVLAGLDAPAAGQVEADGRPLASWPADALARRRALMPQAQYDAFAASVFDTVLAHRFPHLGGWGWGWEGEADRLAARAALAALGLAEFAARDVLTLSGGERQRVALAGVLCQDAPLLLLDEPLAHLDLQHQATCLDALLAWLRVAPRTVIFSCHDLNLARRYATHALLLDGRGGALAGPAREVLSAEAASAAFGYPLVLIERDGHEALVPMWPAHATPPRSRPPPR
ncbi:MULTISPECIES: ABC transporter ATP-binding protein [Burkholderia]|uniref:ABC transporter ATP-binding protein n=1 Tax=Burkholderia TaxID=32008 RepID=UPI0011A444FF|nr:MULTISPECIES: ABC transporter ATP-binding protein [Burkholderia]MDN7739698.1 ABC transporter ATP-binding protein [Burkholderia gladioli]